MNVVDLMLREHDMVNELFALYARAGVVSTASKETVANRIAQAVSEHAKHEEQGLYPYLADHVTNELKAGLVEGAQAQAMMHDLIDDVVRAVGDEPVLDRAMTALGEAVARHFHSEEKDLFRVLRTLFSEEELREVGARIERRTAVEGASLTTRLRSDLSMAPDFEDPARASQADGSP